MQNIEKLITELHKKRDEIKKRFNRHVSIQDLLSDRWETAKFYGFGEGTSCYNNVLILGDVKVGSNSWIGPNVILDGSGGLLIGNYVSVSAGVQIYSHNSIDWSTSLGKEKISFKSTSIGDGVYIGPNTVISMGVTIGEKAVIGAMSFVDKDIPDGQKWIGNTIK